MAAVLCAECGCNPAFVALRDQLQLEYPTLTPAYLRGVNGIIATACGTQDTACV